MSDWSVPEPLRLHLIDQLGAWPPPPGVTVLPAGARERPGWDGAVRPLWGLRVDDRVLLGVPPGRHAEVREAVAARDGWAAVRAVLEGLFLRRVVEAVFRWSDAPAPLDPLGRWLPATDPALPDWLRPFGGEVLAELDEGGRYLAGVGLKRHDAHAREIAVGTEEEARGRGLARRLVATAARAVLDQGFVPTYLHALSNTASARVADAAGFPDAGWRFIELADDEG